MAEEQRNRPAEALAAYQRITEIMPHHFVGWQGVARLSNDYAEACAAAAQALEYAPEDPAEQTLLPYTQARLGKYDEAVASYESALSKYPRNSMLAEEFSKLLSSRRGAGQALQKFQSLVEQKPEWPLGWRMVGYNLVMLSRYSEAEETMQKAIHLDETNPIFWRDLGVIDLVLFQLKDAIRFAVQSEAALRKALELDPQLASASLQLSLALLAQHRAIEAEDFCQKAIQIDGKSVSAWQTLSKIREARGHFSEAVQAIETAIRLSPTEASSWREFGELYTRRHDPAGQEKELRQLLHQLPKAGAGWDSLSILLLAEGKAEAAIDAGRKAVELDDQDPDAWATLGSVEANSGHYEEAIEPLKKAVFHRPLHATAWTTLGSAYLKLGRIEDSIDSSRHALQIHPQSVSDLQNLAAAASEKGDAELVKDACDRLAAINAPLAAELRRQYLK